MFFCDLSSLPHFGMFIIEGSNLSSAICIGCVKFSMSCHFIDTLSNYRI